MTMSPKNYRSTTRFSRRMVSFSGEILRFSLGIIVQKTIFAIHETTRANSVLDVAITDL
jgi:hypothetical protein